MTIRIIQNVQHVMGQAWKKDNKMEKDKNIEKMEVAISEGSLSSNSLI